MRIMPTSPPSRRPGPSWLEGRRRLVIGLTGLLLVLVAGTIGYAGFGLSLLDALFQTVITGNSARTRRPRRRSKAGRSSS
jgi:hypothetical protein